MLSATAIATPITIENPSFEADTPLTNENWPFGVTGWGFGGGGNAGVMSNEHFNEVSDGDNVAWVVNGYLYQVLETTLAIGHTYTLTVDVGRQNGYALPVYSVELWASDSLLASDNSLNPSEGQFLNSTVTYTETGANDGKAIMIGLFSYDSHLANFDNVRLSNSVNNEIVVTPEPSTMLLLGFGLLGVLAGFRRKA